MSQPVAAFAGWNTGAQMHMYASSFLLIALLSTNARQSLRSAMHRYDGNDPRVTTKVFVE